MINHRRSVTIDAVIDGAPNPWEDSSLLAYTASNRPLHHPTGQEVTMFKVIPNGADRLDIELSGKLNGEDMKKMLDELIAYSKDIDNGRMRYRIVDFDFPTFKAIGVELARLPELFKLIRKFDRIAVLAEKSWIRRASEIEGVLIPGLTIKAFELAQSDSAEAWLSNQ